MKIGIDLDGVICDFYEPYEELCVAADNGIDRFPQRGSSVGFYPPVWNWPQHYGYSDAVVDRVWEKIKASNDFWLELKPLPEGQDLIDSGNLNNLLAEHDVYFITARPGARAKQQTEEWFGIHAGLDCPTVLLCNNKFHACRALHLDLYIDDRGENIVDCDKYAWETVSVLLNRPYNAESVVKHRADTLMEALTNGGAFR